MMTFKALYRQKMCDPAFAALYAQECNICSHIVRVFEQIENQCIDLEALSADLKVETTALQALREADRCNPHLVIALCRHLGLEAPGNCPRLK